VELESLRGKGVVLTGGSDGIGREAALQLAELGARVVICARNATKLADVATSAKPGIVFAITADLSTQEGVDLFWTEAKAKLGGVDVLILLERLLRVNTLAYAQLAMLALDSTLPRENAAEAGLAIVVVSSAGGKVGLPRIAPYAACKHALHGFFDSLRHDLVRRQSSASIGFVVLGNIDTASNRAATTGLLSESIKRYPATEAAAAVVRASVDRSRETYYPFWEIAPLAALHAWIPQTVDAVVAHLVEPS
jgi:short-subunit dehydrogenase